MTPRSRWSLAEVKWLVKCLTKAQLDAPDDNHRFGPIRDIKVLSEEFCAGGHGNRSAGAIRVRVGLLRAHFGCFARDVPDDIKEARDSCRLIEWILNNCDPFGEKNINQKEENNGETVNDEHVDDAKEKNTGKEEGEKEKGRPGQKEMVASNATQHSKHQLQQIEQFHSLMTKFIKEMSQGLQDEQKDTAAGS